MIPQGRKYISLDVEELIGDPAGPVRGRISGRVDLPLDWLDRYDWYGRRGCRASQLDGRHYWFYRHTDTRQKMFVRNFHPKSTIATDHLKFTICIQIESWLKTHFSLVFRLAKALGS